MDNYENFKTVVDVILTKIDLLAEEKVEIPPTGFNQLQVCIMRDELYKLVDIMRKEASIIEHERQLAYKKLELIKELLDTVQ